MLCVNSYPKVYVDDCRARVDAQLSAYRSLLKAAHKGAGDDAGTSNLAGQRRFFDAHLRGWVDSMCSAIEAHPDADFYAALARFTRDFFAVEAQAFDLLDI